MTAMLRQALFITFILVMQAVRLDAQWPVDPTKNLEIVVNGVNPEMVSDGFGGAIVVSEIVVSYRYLVAQRVDKDGYILWDESLRGIEVVRKGAQDQTRYPHLLTDGHGGVFIAYVYETFIGWIDEPPYQEIEWSAYVQHMGSNGEVIWGDRGVLLSTPIQNEGVAGIVSDTEGGMIVVWTDMNGSHAQRLDAEGNRLWGANGIFVSEVNYGYVVSDGNGSATAMPPYGPGGQRINGNGQLLWDEEEIDARVGAYGEMVGDEEGGVVICGHHYDNATGTHAIRVQRIDAMGMRKWGEQGTIIHEESTDWPFPRLAYEKGAGAFLTWSNYWEESDVYAQKLTCDGQTCWDRAISVCEASGDQFFEEVTYDGVGGAVFVWQDGRGNAPGIYHIYAQRVSGEGQILWDMDGIPVSLMDTGYVPSIITDSTANSIVVWYTLGRKRSTFIQKIDKDGDLGGSKGDVNRDGVANIIDALRVANSIIGVGPILSEYERWASDTNDDGEINIEDLIDIVNRILGIRPE